MCRRELLCLSKKLTVPAGSKPVGLNLLVHKSTVALRSTHGETLASRSHSRCCRHRRTKCLGSGSSVACSLGTDFQELQHLLLAWRDQASWLVCSVTHWSSGSSGACLCRGMGSSGVSVRGSSLYTRGKNGVLSSCVCWDARLTVKCRGGNPCGDVLCRGSRVLHCDSFVLFLPWLFASLFVHSEMALLLPAYGTSCVPFESLIFHLQESLSLVGLRDVNNLPYYSIILNWFHEGE
jgi:hypothetical protein